jgi:WD40 repeat protein
LDLRPVNQRFCVFSLKFNSTGDEILCGCSDEKVYLYDLVTKQRLFVLSGGHTDDINAISWLDDSNQVFASGSDDSAIRIWDRRVLSSGVDDYNNNNNNNNNTSSASSRRNRAVGSLIGHSKGITFIDTRNDGRYLISNGKDQCMKLWDCRISMQSGDAPPLQMNDRFDYRWQRYHPGHRVIRRMTTRANAHSSDDDENNSDIAVMLVESENSEDDVNDEDYDIEGEYTDGTEGESEAEEGEDEEADEEIEHAMDYDEEEVALRALEHGLEQAMNEGKHDDDDENGDMHASHSDDEAYDADTGGYLASSYEAANNHTSSSSASDGDNKDKSVMTYRGHRVLETLIRCRFSPAHTTGNKYVYSGSQDGDVYIYDVLTGQLQSKLSSAHESTVRDVSWHPYLPQIITSSWDYTSMLWKYQPKQR